MTQEKAAKDNFGETVYDKIKRMEKEKKGEL